MAGEDTCPGLLPSGSEKVGGSGSICPGTLVQGIQSDHQDFHFSSYTLLQKHGGIVS